MTTGVLLMLGGGSLIFGSWPAAGWMLGFFFLNSLHFVLAEEPGLERRLGKDYRRYKSNASRWIPRLTPWESDRDR